MSEIRHKDRILEAIDQLRRRKARPDIERICHYLSRRFGVDSKDTLSDLQRLVDSEVVIKVEYKGNTSYRNAAKWSKFAMYKSKENTITLEIHGLISRAFATLLVDDPDYLDFGVPGKELEKFLMEDDPCLEQPEIELILKKETASGFLVKLGNGNYSLADHPIPDKPRSPPSSTTVTVVAKSSCENFQPAEKTEKPKVASSNKVSKKGKVSENKQPVLQDTKKEITGAINVGGFRVGVRRKRAKKVFDPSDNYTPTRKRGRPVGSTNANKKEALISGGICSICNQQSSYRKPVEKLIPCRDCTNKAHPSCIDCKLIGKQMQSFVWTCMTCKLCSFCFETSENEAMAICINCNDGYHLTCHNPPITDEEWEGKWTCSRCSTADSPPEKAVPITEQPIQIEKDLKPVSAMEARENPVVDLNIPDVSDWSVEQIFKYLSEKGCPKQAESFKFNEIDGRSLLLMTRADIIYSMNLKLGPALKVFRQVQMLQTKDPRIIYP